MLEIIEYGGNIKHRIFELKRLHGGKLHRKGALTHQRFQWIALLVSDVRVS